MVLPLAIFLLALAARAGFGLYAFPAGGADALQYDDERWYWSMAESYRRGEGFVGEFGHRAERMPLYPWFLSLFAETERGPAAARWAQWALGALAASLTYLLARRVRAAPLLAGLIVAFDPGLTGSASLLLTETLFVTSIVALWLIAWPLRRRGGGSAARWLAMGLAACVSVYLRESSLVFVAALVAYLLVVRRDRRAVLGAVTVVLMVFVALVPWAYRNSRVIGQWCWLTTRGGISLYDGVRPGATGASDLAAIKDAPEVGGLSEVEWNRYFYRASRQAILDDPVRIVGLVPIKLARTWSPVLHAAEYQSAAIRTIFAAWYVPLYALALLGLWARRRDGQVCAGLLLPAVCVSLLHGVFVGSVRYRLGALPTLAVLAAVGIDYLVGLYRERRGKQQRFSSEAVA